MAYQTNSNAYIARKVQSALGSMAGASGASIIRTAGGQGGRLSKAAIESNEVRRDGMRSRGRHGSQRTAGSYTTEYSNGNIDDIIEAVMRGTYEAALTKTQVQLTSIVTTSTTITVGGGDLIALGFRVGDVIQLGGAPDAANNGINIRITGLTATVITTPDTLVANATPDTTFSISRVGQKLINPGAGAMVQRYHTIEEYEIDIDRAEIFSDCVWGSLTFSMSPDSLLMANPGWVGTGQFLGDNDGVSVPYFSSPSESVADPMSVVDAKVRVGGGDALDLTNFELTIDLGLNSPNVAASLYAPDVFPGNMSISASITLLRDNYANVQRLLSETQIAISVLAAHGANFLSIYVPNLTLGGVDKSALSNAGGARTETLAIPAALVGKDQRGGAFDPTMIKFQVL
jgi:hypothetical protein